MSISLEATEYKNYSFMFKRIHNSSKTILNLYIKT